MQAVDKLREWKELVVSKTCLIYPGPQPRHAANRVRHWVTKPTDVFERVTVNDTHLWGEPTGFNMTTPLAIVFAHAAAERVADILHALLCYSLSAGPESVLLSVGTGAPVSLAFELAEASLPRPPAPDTRLLHTTCWSVEDASADEAEAGGDFPDEDDDGFQGEAGEDEAGAQVPGASDDASASASGAFDHAGSNVENAYNLARASSDFVDEARVLRPLNNIGQYH